MCSLISKDVILLVIVISDECGTTLLLPSLPPTFCSLLAKMEEVHSHHSTAAKERKHDRIALASTSSDLLCTHICSSGGKDSDSSVEKDNKNKLRGQLKGKNCVKTIMCTCKMST